MKLNQIPLMSVCTYTVLYGDVHCSHAIRRSGRMEGLSTFRLPFAMAFAGVR